MSLILDGKPRECPGLVTRSWLDPGGLRLGREDHRPRVTRWIRSIILHATVGDEPQIVRAGAGPSGMAARTVAAWESDRRHAGAHLLVDGDGTIFCVADLVTEATYHAETINEVSIGIELCESRALEVWIGQLDALVLLVDELTRLLGIQRQIHAPYHAMRGPVPRLAEGGADCVGIFGHRDQTWKRGQGDPGDAALDSLAAAGYDRFNFATNTDLRTWSNRQMTIEVWPDGVPGPLTRAQLETHGRPCGMWVPRPGDTPPPAAKGAPNA